MEPVKKTTLYDHLIKMLLIGDSSVGKSSLLTRFNDDSFSIDFISTIGIDFKVKTLLLDGKKYKLQIWDTAGQERFRTITTAYYRGAMGVILVFSLNSISSFASIKNWIQNIHDHVNHKVPIILVGNKSDLVRMVTKEEIDELVKELDLTYYETSAKTGLNVDAPFVEMTKACIKQYIENPVKKPVADIIRPTDEVSKTKCCGF
jgi:Ras-related protein Rab-8A